MAENLTFINSHLIGVSFINSEENKQIQNQWNYRFRAENADWIQVTDGNQSVDDVLGRIVQLRKGQGQNLAGLQIVLTGFLDMFQENVEWQTDFLENLASELQRNHAIMRPVIQFAYVGKNPSPEAEALRSRVTMVAEKNFGKVCLVGRSVTVDDSLCWKPEMLLLDVLRRSQNPLQHLPLPNQLGAIGYLRYAQHSQSQITQADAAIAHMKKCLSEEGQDSFRAGIRALIDEIAEKAPADFPVDGAMQPLHPDVFVNPNKFHFTGKYKKQFEAAQRESSKAIEATGSRMIERMKERYIPTDAEADDMIRKVIEQRQPGYGMLEKLRPEQLNLSAEGALIGGYITLGYNPNGYSGVITQYLQGRREDGVLQCQQAMLEKLMEAFQRVRPEYTGKIEAMSQELKKQEDLRKKMTSNSSFLLDVTSTGFLLGGCFTPTANYMGDTRRCLLWRESSDRELVMNAAYMEECFIDRENGQLKNVDEYQLKMLEIYFAERKPAVAQDLIREKK